MTRITTGENMLSLRLPAQIENRLDQLAQTTGRTKTFYAKEAILRYLDEMEDVYYALDRQETPKKRWSLDDLENDIDLEG